MNYLTKQEDIIDLGNSYYYATREGFAKGVEESRKGLTGAAANVAYCEFMLNSHLPDRIASYENDVGPYTSNGKVHGYPIIWDSESEKKRVIAGWEQTKKEYEKKLSKYKKQQEAEEKAAKKSDSAEEPLTDKMESKRAEEEEKDEKVGGGKFKDKVSDLKGKFADAKGKISDLKKKVGDVMKDPMGALMDKSGLNSLSSKISSSVGGKFDAAMNKVLGSDLLKNNPLLNSLVGSAMGFAKDLASNAMATALDMGKSYMNSMIDDLKNQVNAYLKLPDEIVLAEIQSLCYAGSDPNYQNCVLNCCLKHDYPKTLRWLDHYNKTVYTLNSKEYSRGRDAARKGSYKVALYIAEELEREMKRVSNLPALDEITRKKNDGLALKYKQEIVGILKDIFVCSYTNFGVSEANKILSDYRDIFTPKNLGTKDDVYNGKFTINGGDINKMAPIVSVPAGISNPFEGSNLRFGLEMKKKNELPVYEEFIDVRNYNIKAIYIRMYNGFNPQVDRIDNKDLHKRLKYRMLTSQMKARAAAMRTLYGSSIMASYGNMADTFHQAIYKMIQAKEKYMFDPSQTTAMKFTDTNIPEYAEIIEGSNGKGNESNIKNPPLKTTDTSANTRDEARRKALEVLVIPPVIREKLEATWDDFYLIDTLNRSDAEISAEIMSVAKEYSYLTDTINMSITKINGEGEYIVKNDFIILTSKKGLWVGLDEIDKRDAFYYLLVKFLIEKYGWTNPLASMIAWHGHQFDVEVYKTDNSGNLILNDNGNYIKETITVNEVDQRLSEISVVFNEYYNKYVSYAGTSMSGSYTIKFDTKGIFTALPDITNIFPNQRITKYKPVDPVTNDFVFTYWSTDYAGTQAFKWDTDVVLRDLTLYANYRQNFAYVNEIAILADENDEFTRDIYGTVDEEALRIYWFVTPEEAEILEESNPVIYLKYTGLDCSMKSGDRIPLSDNFVIVGHPVNGKRYNFQTITVPEGSIAVSMVTRGGHLPQNTQFVYGSNALTLDLPLPTYNGMRFVNWTDKEGRIISIRDSRFSEMTTIFANYEEIPYTINYFDKGGVAFSGEADYLPKKTTYFANTYLPIPTKDGYEFEGWYTDSACATNKISGISAFTCLGNINVYAKWISRTLSDNFILDKNGKIIKVRDILFYTSLLDSSNQRWEISMVGINVYKKTGEKKTTINGVFGSSSRYPIAVAYQDGLLFVLVTDSSRRYFVYYSTDMGLSWEGNVEADPEVVEIFNGCGVMSVTNFVFYKKFVYNANVFELAQGKIFFDMKLDIFSHERFEILPVTPILGFNVAINERMYVLFKDIGVYEVQNFFPIVTKNDNGVIESIDYNPNILFRRVSGWIDDLFNVDNISVGTPFKTVNSNFNSDPDFDIENTNDVNNVLAATKPGSIKIRTYLSAFNAVLDEDWIWRNHDQFDNPLYTVTTESNGQYIRPNIQKSPQDIYLEIKGSDRKDDLTPSIENLFITKEGNYEARAVDITKENCDYYIGYTVLSGNGGTKITEENAESFIGSNVRLYYTRSQLTDEGEFIPGNPRDSESFNAYVRNNAGKDENGVYKEDDYTVFDNAVKNYGVKEEFSKKNYSSSKSFLAYIAKHA